MQPLDQTWSLPDSLDLEGYDFPLPPPEPPKDCGYTPHLQNNGPGPPDPVDSAIQAAVHLLVLLGLKPSQIRQLRKREYRDALLCIADAHEDDIDTAWAACPVRQPHHLLQRGRTRISHQSSVQYPSGVPSLISDRGSVATNFSLPMSDSTASGPAYFSDTSYAPPTWMSLSDEMHFATGVHNPNAPTAYHRMHEQHTIFQPTDQYNVHTTFSNHQQNNPGDDLNDSGVTGMRTLYPSDSGKSQSPMATNRSVLVPEEEPPRNRTQKVRFPCPDHGCAKDFSSTTELTKHLAGDHDKDATFRCKHPGCIFDTNRAEMWKRHHSTAHRECRGHSNCVEEIRTRERKHWGCGLCVRLFTDARSYAEHYKDHFEEGKSRKSEINFPTIIRSLLKQEATKHKWEKRISDIQHSEGKHYLAWVPGKSENIREALEYGTFDGRSIEDPAVADMLLDEVLAQARRNPKRHASTSPDHGDMQTPGIRMASYNQTYL